MAYDLDNDAEQGEGVETPEGEAIETYRDWFKAAYEADEPQRKREEEDLRFQSADEQWDEGAKQARMGGITGGLAVPPRPILSVSKIAQPIDLVNAAARNAELGISAHPVSEDADAQVARIYEGLISRIERDSDASDAYLFAHDRAAKAGRGYWIVTVRPDEDADEDDPRAFDMEIGIERILYQSCVYFDPAAQRKDYSDAEYAFITQWVPAEKFKRLYPKAKVTADAATSDLLFKNLQSEAPLWVQQKNGGKKAFLVAECYYKKHDPQTLYLLGDGTVTDDPPKGAEIVNKRVRDKVTVCRAEITAADILTHEVWLGRYIPIVAVMGRELQPYDEQRRIEGMIRPARDAQKFFNAAISNFVERMAAEPKTPWVMAEGQDEGHEQEWLLANVRNLPVLHYKPTSLDGSTPTPPPQRAQLDSTGMSLALQGAQFGTSLIQDATATYDPSLGKASNQHESGRKVLALQSQADQAAGAYTDNLVRALKYCGRVLVDLIPKVYDAPGRITTILGGDDQKAEKVVLGPQGTMPPPEEPNLKVYDLSRGRYGVAATVGKKNETRLQEGGEQIGQLLQADPELAPIISDIWVRFLDIPGGQEIADRLQKFARMKYPGLMEEGDGDDLQKMQAENAALKQQLQELSGQMKDMGTALETKQVEQQAKVAIEQARAQVDLEIARMTNAAKIEVARISAAASAMNQQAAAQEERLATGLQIQHEATQAAHDRAHEAGMAAMGQGHSARTAEAQGERDASMAQDGRDHEAAMAQEEAARAGEAEAAETASGEA